MKKVNSGQLSYLSENQRKSSFGSRYFMVYRLEYSMFNFQYSCTVTLSCNELENTHLNYLF